MRAILLLIASLFASLFLSVPLHAEVRDPQSHFFNPKLGDFADELNVARGEGKLGVLIMFEMEDCPFCARMKGSVLNQSEVQDWYRKHFLIFSVDVKGDAPMTDFKGQSTTEKAFALAQRARATPAFMFFDLEGQRVARYDGATRDAAEFMLLGRYVREAAYKRMPFNVYKQQAATQTPAP